MAIKQLTVFIENKKGTVVSVTEILAENNVNIRALSVAETQDFGMLRLIVNDEETAEKALAEQGYMFRTIDVVGVKINDEPGKLSEALSVMEKADINVEYLYAFMSSSAEYAYVVLRVEDNEKAESELTKAGFALITNEDVSSI